MCARLALERAAGDASPHAPYVRALPKRSRRTRSAAVEDGVPRGHLRARRAPRRAARRGPVRGSGARVLRRRRAAEPVAVGLTGAG